MLKKEQLCQNNSENSYIQRKAKHKPSGYSLSLIYSFDETKNRHKFYRRKDCIKRFGNDLKELATEMINYEQKQSFVMIKIRKANILFIIKSEIIAIMPGNLGELLIIFPI